MYTKLEVMAMMCEDGAPEFRLFNAEGNRKAGWLRRLFIAK